MTVRHSRFQVTRVRLLTVDSMQPYLDPSRLNRVASDSGKAGGELSLPVAFKNTRFIPKVTRV
jgi:hypothetical protein